MGPLLRIFLVLLALSACFRPVGIVDCLDAGTCECTVKAECPAGRDCVDGRCVLEPKPPPPKDFGQACDAGARCSTGLCLPEGPKSGRACTARCDDDGQCPQSWECKQVDSQPLCVPPLATLCLECTTASDCNAAGDACIAGHCGRDCHFSACPSGYTCSAERQCVPTAGTCECSSLTAGLQRPCDRAADAGRCFGHEVCRPDGTWSGCDARAPAAEICNGLDDDCDGLVDTLDPSIDTSSIAGSLTCRRGDAGICVGTWACASDGGWACSATDPVPEVCNGRDDDCDARADEDFVDPAGRYLDPRHCGACGFDCQKAIAHVADGGAACELAPGPTCVPKRCAPGYWPFPESAPSTCALIVDPSCRPCTTASECLSSFDRCEVLGTEPGKSCLRSCEAASPYGCTGQTGAQGCCPSGFTCDQVGADKLCRPMGGTCSCNAMRVGQARSCFVGTPPAACTGSQLCQASGTWGTCSTTMSTNELCDGVDNDCDGLADEDFIGTRGTMTYDTDEHCGACAVSCPAQWSQSIQHAIGGCDAGPGRAPACAIARCTVDSVAVAAACRLDTECPSGFACDGVFHHCARSCNASADCGDAGVCAEGRCGPRCSSSASCGSGLSCSDAGACVKAFTFVDTDRESTNGCECPSSGAADDPDTFTTWPAAGWPYVDRNCDGVDGIAATSLFVSAASTQSLGTRASPYRTIGEAMTAFNPATHSAILVAAGSYVENVRLKDGVKLFGGYAPGFATRDVVTFPSIIEGLEPLDAGSGLGTVSAIGVTSPSVFAGFTVRGYDVTSAARPGQAALPSYGIYVKNASASLRIVNNHVIAGRGGQGVTGAPGVAGDSGGAGGRGLNSRECMTPNCTGEAQTGGTLGANPGCAAVANGVRGGSVTPQQPQQEYQDPLGLNGRGGTSNQYTRSDDFDGGSCKPQCTILGDSNGQPASAGSDGFATGPGLGCLGSGGLVGDHWLQGSGTVGSAGSHGRGGGGGGAGGNVANTMFAGSCVFGNRVGDLGSTGGGGGAGGCGGTAGQGGTGGGASFGIFVIANGAQRPVLEGNTIDTGHGGAGGNGGPGGYGGVGGAGGEAGISQQPAWCAGNAGKGGRGGAGGAGSGGGGGCGGIAFGIAVTGATGTGYGVRNSFGAVPANAPGVAGAGGPSPAGAAFKGADAAPAAAGTFQEL